MTLLFAALLLAPSGIQETPSRVPAAVRNYEEREASAPELASFAGGDKWSGADIQLAVWLVAAALTLVGAVLQLLFGWLF